MYSDDDRCVACGRVMEMTPGYYRNHHCPQSTERRDRIMSRGREHDERRRTYSQRLRDGFRMLAFG